MNSIISTLNEVSLCTLQNMVIPPYAISLWIEGGRITGYMNIDTGVLHKEIPTQTANPSGDE